jgi:hypothetical protein
MESTPISQTVEIVDFGIKRITKSEQEKLLELASQDIVFENEDVINNREKFETNGKISPKKIKDFNQGNVRQIGYCKSANCKKQIGQTRIPVHSADFSPYVHYHCLKCLASILCDSRAESKGCSVSVQFRPSLDVSKEIGISQASYEVEAKIVNDTFYINGEKVDGHWEKTAPSEKYINSKIIVESKIAIKTDSSTFGYLTGTYPGHIKGRNVCQNICVGKPCVSMQSDYKPIGFVAKSVPPGVPGWKEDHALTREGRIITHMFCPGCSAENIDAHHWSNKSPKKNTQIKPEFDYKKEYDDLKKICSGLLDEIARINKENADLRYDMAEMKAKEIRRQLSDKKN